MRLIHLTLVALALAGCRTDDTGIEDTTIVDSDDQDGDGFAAADDCDDTNAAINPDATETCDGVDQDCDGTVDDDATDASTFYADGDGDDYGVTDSSTKACSAPSGYAAESGDCDDADAAVHPGAAETDCADPTDYNCDGSTGFADADGDGEPACTDCDDTNAEVNPSAVEACNSIDDDCDAEVDEAGATGEATFYADADGDTYGDATATTSACEAPSGYTSDATDCDDSSSTTWPGATETCDTLDNDCDGTADEDASDAGTFYADTDADGFGDAGAPTTACAQPSGTVSDATDCDDASASRYPGATELCDGLDNDCDGGVPSDEGDGDSDGSPACEDCDDVNPDVHPGATELCNTIDDDCDGGTDVGAADEKTFYADADGDGFGKTDDTLAACEAPTGYAAADGDCDDAEPAVNPGADLGCGTEDLDCDGEEDGDADGDGFESTDCGGFDCDDADGTKKPGVGGTCVSGKTCADALTNGFDANGVYRIDPDGSGPLPITPAFCDQKTDGGGWTLAWRTVWDATETAPLFTTQKDWHDKSVNAPGSRTKAYRLAGKYWPALQGKADHLLVHTLRRADGTSCAPLYYKGTEAKYTVSATSPVTLDKLPVSNVNFAADTTMDFAPNSCVSSSKAVPWFYTGCCTTCPTFQGGYWPEAHPMQSYSGSAKDLNGKTHVETCGTGPKAPVASSGYFGGNIMEYYLR